MSTMDHHGELTLVSSTIVKKERNLDTRDSKFQDSHEWTDRFVLNGAHLQVSSLGTQTRCIGHGYTAVSAAMLPSERPGNSEAALGYIVKDRRNRLHRATQSGLNQDAFDLHG